MSDQTSTTPTQSSSSNPYTLWFVILSFAAPVAAAYYMFFFGDISSFSNNGEFIRPYYNISELKLQRDGESFNEDALEDKWLLMLATGASCDEACRQKLINIRQIKRAVKRPPKIRYALIRTAQPDTDFQAFLDEEMTDAIMLNADAAHLGLRTDLTGQVSPMLLSDPYGNMVMRFETELVPKLVIKDLNRLF